MILNYSSPELLEYLPPNDSRLRPDNRNWEEGNEELAD